MLRMVMMPSNDFPGGNLIYCHGEEREKKDLGDGRRSGGRKRYNPHQHFIGATKP